MKGNRIKIENENTPVTETQKLTDGTYQFRYDFTEVEATEESPASFNYKYVNVPDLSRGTIVTAIIRTRYTSDQEAAIVRKKQANEDILDFVKYNNFANYAKAMVDELSTEDYEELKLQIEDNQFNDKAAKRLLRKIAEPIIADEDNLTEQDIEDIKMLFSQWRGNGVSYEIDDKVVHDGKLYKVIQSHTSQNDWNPLVAVSLFVEIAPPGVIPEWTQPAGTHDAYNTGDEVIFEGTHYQSLIDANVWSPTAYPQGWEVV